MNAKQFYDAIWAFPSPNESALLYTFGFACILVPWVLGYAGARIIEALGLFKRKD